MNAITLGNMKFEVEVSVNSPAGVIRVMKSAECLQTGIVYSKEKANKYYRMYSV